MIMEKEEFRTEVHELLRYAFERMSKTVDNFCDSSYKGFDSYDNNSEMSFVQALLELEAFSHSAAGCTEYFQRKVKKMVTLYKNSILNNR